MTGITRTRHESIQSHAADLLIQAGGVGHLDALSAQARKPALVSLAHALVQAESVTYETARRHIARACRRARYPDYTPPRWGGVAQPRPSPWPGRHQHQPVRGMPGIDPAETNTSPRGQRRLTMKITMTLAKKIADKFELISAGQGEGPERDEWDELVEWLYAGDWGSESPAYSIDLQQEWENYKQEWADTHVES